jgi:serine/threonine protein kinase/energy-coupling factor transporter ATP-binding protein EcfA2
MPPSDTFGTAHLGKVKHGKNSSEPITKWYFSGIWAADVINKKGCKIMQEGNEGIEYLTGGGGLGRTRRITSISTRGIGTDRLSRPGAPEGDQDRHLQAIVGASRPRLNLMSGSVDHSVRTTTGLEPSGGADNDSGGADDDSGGADNDIFLLHVDIQRGMGLIDVQFLIPQDPYVKVVLPDGTGERTKCVSGGGTDPEWNNSHGKHITLELNKESMPCSLSIQVWNENDGYFESDDMIGTAEATLQLEQLQMTAEQLQEGKVTHRRIRLDPQGILVLEMYILTVVRTEHKVTREQMLEKEPERQEEARKRDDIELERAGTKAAADAKAKAQLDHLEKKQQGRGLAASGGAAAHTQGKAADSNASIGGGRGAAAGAAVAEAGAQGGTFSAHSTATKGAREQVAKLLEAVAAQAKPSKKQKYQLNFLRFSTILIDELSISLRTLFMQLWNNRYPNNHWGVVSNTESGKVCWDGTAFTIDSNMTVKYSRKNNLHTESTLEEGVAYLKTETGTLDVNDKMVIGDQECVVQNVKNNSKRAGGSTITVNTLTAFDGSLSIFVQKIKYERKVTDQMRIPFARKVRAGEIGEWDISLLMFLLCKSSHVLLQQDCDAEGLKLLGDLRKLRNNCFGHIGNCSLSDVELRRNVAIILKFADSTLNHDDLKERVMKVMSEQYSFPNTTAADVQRWDEAQESWETHFKKLDGKIDTLGTQVAKLASTSEAADILTHAKLDALLMAGDRRPLVEGVSLEDKALRDEILALLEGGAENQRLVTAKLHVKKGDVEQAYKCIKQTISSDTLLPEDLAEAKILFAYTCNKLGLRRLRKGKFIDAAVFFGDLLDNPATSIAGERLQKLRRFHACSLYESGKKARRKGNWETAAEQFCLAQETKMLPGTLSNKCGAYLQQCKERRKALRESTAKVAVAIKAKMGESTAKVAVAQTEEEAFGLYKKAKRDLRLGNIGAARALFKEALNSGLPNGLEERTADYIDKLDDMEEEHIAASSTACVFDHATQNLGSSMSTLGMLGLSTKTLLARPLRTNHSSQELIMVLDDKFPPNTKARGALILQLKVDIRKALNCLAEIQIIGIENGSVIVHFRFVSDREHDNEASLLGEEYLRQIDSKDSRLYQGELTCRIDQKLTQTMTMALSTIVSKSAPCMYQAGDTITLAEVAEEKIECQVDSLLGEGATARIFKVTTGGKVCALKVFKAECSFIDLSEEASLLLVSNHPQSHANVLRADFVWYEQRTNEMFFLVELIDGGNLQTWMDDERLYAGTIDEQQRRLITIAHQLICGVRHLHQRGILHQDIKPENVFMTANGKPVLGDLGVASKGVIDSAGMLEATLRGATPVYASPHVRELFFRTKAVPANQRIALLMTNKITHLDDFWAMAATIIDTFAECGWRRGPSVAEVLVNKSSLAGMVSNTKLLRVALPSDMLELLQNCLGFGAAPRDLTINFPVELMSRASLRSPVPTEGLNGKRCANIYNNLAIALSDSGHHDKAHTLLERAVAADSGDVRSQNNLGVVKLAQGEVDSAFNCFHKALKLEPDHQLATFNAGVRERHEAGAVARFDRSGVAGVVEDSSGQVALAGAVSFVPEQQVEVHQQGKWMKVLAKDVSSSTPLLLLNYRLSKSEVIWYKEAQQIFVLHRGLWCIGVVDKAFQGEFKQEMQEAPNKAYDPVPEHEQHREAARERARQQLASKHAISIKTKHHGNGRANVALQLNESNHAPALFRDCNAMERATKAYKIELIEKHASIIDIFSGQQLSTRTQTATLEYHEAEHAARVLNKNHDLDSLEYQHAFKAASAKHEELPVQQTRLSVTSILDRMCSIGTEREVELVLILGPAASGKSTLLKTLIMAVVNQYRDLVPILIPIIEVVPVLGECDRKSGESVVAAFLQQRYPQHVHLLLQMIHMHRVVFLIDGIDESGSSREAIEDFVLVELLERQHKTIVTSRHSGFSSNAFKQCQLVELLPLSVEQQSQMVRTRVPVVEQAEQLVQELGCGAFKEISSNPLMLTMMISIYLNNNCKLISNRSELYEKALRTIVSRADKSRTGVDVAAQDDLFEHLQRLASGSHQRDGEQRRIFTTAEASEWVGTSSWESIRTKIHTGLLPVIVSIGPNGKDEEEYRFGHMSYQEYLTGREYYQELTAARFSTAALRKLFGHQPMDAFTDVKQHLVLQLLAGILSPEQRTICLAVMCGGLVEAPVLMRKPSRKSAMSTRCAVVGCTEAHTIADGYCNNHREAAASALGNAKMHSGDTLKIEKKLGHADMEALAPYIRDNTRLRTLVLSGAKLGKDGVEVLVQALETNTTVAVLDLSNNDLQAAGAKVVAELLARCVREC